MNYSRNYVLTKEQALSGLRQMCPRTFTSDVPDRAVLNWIDERDGWYRLPYDGNMQYHECLVKEHGYKCGCCGVRFYAMSDIHRPSGLCVYCAGRWNNWRLRNRNKPNGVDDWLISLLRRHPDWINEASHADNSA